MPLANGNFERVVPSVSVSTSTQVPSALSVQFQPESPVPRLGAARQSTVDSYQVRILGLTPGTISATLFIWCNTGRRITMTWKQSAAVVMEERKCTRNVAAWNRARTGLMCPEPPARRAREGKYRLDWPEALQKHYKHKPRSCVIYSRAKSKGKATCKVWISKIWCGAEHGIKIEQKIMPGKKTWKQRVSPKGFKSLSVIKACLQLKSSSVYRI